MFYFLVENITYWWYYKSKEISGGEELIKCLVEQLKTIRLKKGVTMIELSKRTGISQKHISNIENNKTVPTVITLNKVAHGLEARIDFSITDGTVLS